MTTLISSGHRSFTATNSGFSPLRIALKSMVNIIVSHPSCTGTVTMGRRYIYLVNQRIWVSGSSTVQRKTTTTKKSQPTTSYNTNQAEICACTAGRPVHGESLFSLPPLFYTVKTTIHATLLTKPQKKTNSQAPRENLANIRTPQ